MLGRPFAARVKHWRQTVRTMQHYERQPMLRHHDASSDTIPAERFVGRVFISGTGRTGTTLLVQLLSDLGLNTGFSPETATTGDASSGPARYSATVRAGLERDPFDPANPFIVKSPFLCDFLPRVVGSRDRHCAYPGPDPQAGAADPADIARRFRRHSRQPRPARSRPPFQDLARKASCRCAGCLPDNHHHLSRRSEKDGGRDRD